MEGLHDGDAATFADEDRFRVKGDAERGLGGEAVFGIWIGDVGLAVVAGFHLDLDAWRAMPFEVAFDLFHNVFRQLVGDEPEGQFHKRLSRQDGLRALALVAAADAVHLGGRARPGALGGGVTGLPEETGRAGDGEEIRIAHAGQRGPHLMFPIFQRPDLIVKSLDGDAAVERVKAGNEPRHRGGRIGDRTTEEAGVEVAFGAAQDDIAAGDAAQSVAERGHAGRDHAGIGNGDDIALQLIAMMKQKGRKARTADLLLALEEEDQIHRQLTVFPQGFFHT